MNHFFQMATSFKDAMHMNIEGKEEFFREVFLHRIKYSDMCRKEYSIAFNYAVLFIAKQFIAHTYNISFLENPNSGVSFKRSFSEIIHNKKIANIVIEYRDYLNKTDSLDESTVLSYLSIYMKIRLSAYQDRFLFIDFKSHSVRHSERNLYLKNYEFNNSYLQLAKILVMSTPYTFLDDIEKYTSLNSNGFSKAMVLNFMFDAISDGFTIGSIKNIS